MIGVCVASSMESDPPDHSQSIAMNIQFVPLLSVMRELYRIPRGTPPDFNGLARFHQYLRTIFPHDDSADQLLPLLAMNPMAKDHVTVLLDDLLAMDADGLAARVVAEAASAMSEVPGDFKIGVVIADDRLGGWTNRYDIEFTHRFGDEAIRLREKPKPRPRWFKDDWLTALLWGSEPPTERAVRESVLTVIHRRAYGLQHGLARTLREMLAQEGEVMARAGCVAPVLEADDVEYTREVLAPFLEADNKRTCMECLFGDAPCRTLGFTPRGLSSWAGFALALHDAQLRTNVAP